MSDLLDGRLGAEVYAPDPVAGPSSGPSCSGQIIRDRAGKTRDFEKAGDGDGVRFYVSEEIPNPAAFKRVHRELLERQRVVAECRQAFTLNTGVFRALGEEFPVSA